jgi:hypothetical protein
MPSYHLRRRSTGTETASSWAIQAHDRVSPFGYGRDCIVDPLSRKVRVERANDHSGVIEGATVM